MSTSLAPTSRPADGRPEFLVRLGVMLPATVADVKQAYLEKAKAAHPDHGGSPDDFKSLQQAFERATEFATFHEGRRKWLAVQTERYIEQQELIALVGSLGGQVETEGVAWMKQELGEDFAQVLDKVVAINLRGTAAGDAHLAQIAASSARANCIRAIDLAGTAITDEGLAALKAFCGIKSLDLSGTAITDASLPVIESLSSLERLVLQGSGVSVLSLYRLRLQMPNVTVVG